MARSRQIKPDFFLNEGLAAMPALTRLLFIGLWTLADREGRIEDRPERIRVQVFPYEHVDVDAMLAELAGGFLERYCVGEIRCIQIRKFKKHQHIHPDEKASILPPPPEIPGDFRKPPEIMHRYKSSSSSPSPSSNGGRKRPPFAPPSLADVVAYCRERNQGVVPEKWMAHYESNGWRVGKNPMRDWRAAVRSWEHNDFGGKAARPTDPYANFPTEPPK